MKKILCLVLPLLFLTHCSSIKKSQNLLNSGNYDEAIHVAISKLNPNKSKKENQVYYRLIEDAFAKAKEKDLNEIEFLEKEANPNKIERLYNLYSQLNARQEKIKPLLPMPLVNEGRNAKFSFDNYSDQILSTQNKLADYLYENAKRLMFSSNKMDFRNAFDDLVYLNKISPNYRDINQLMDEARFKGTDFVFVNTKNETNMIIPTRLQDFLLDFNTYGLNDKWTEFHKSKQKGIVYDFGLVLSFIDINISPEQIKEREFVKEREIKDGQKIAVDSNGKEILNEKGKPVMVDVMKTVNCRIYEVRQLKTSQVRAKVDYIHLKSNQMIQTFPISSEFVFENIYSTFKGDRRAADDSYIYFNRGVVPFPNNEQMVYDTGEDLKRKIKDILIRNKFRN